MKDRQAEEAKGYIHGIAAPLIAKGRPPQGTGDAIDAYRRITHRSRRSILRDPDDEPSGC